MKTIRSILILLCCVSAYPSHGQDPGFSQYNSAPLYLNPGLAGSTGYIRTASAFGVFRSEWSGIYTNFYSSYDHYIRQIRGGAGLMYMNERAADGLFTSNRFDFVYAAHFNLFNEKLIIRPGIDIGYCRKKIDMEGLTFGDMIDPRRGFVYTTTEGTLTSSFIDLAAGLVFATKYVNGGFAMHHFTEPDQGLIGSSKLPVKYTVHLAGVIGSPDSSNAFSISPHAIFQQQRDFQSYLFGATARYDKYLLGLGCRNLDLIVLQAGFQNELLRVGYSYDLALEQLVGHSIGYHELTLSFNIRCKQKKRIAPFATIAF